MQLLNDFIAIKRQSPRQHVRDLYKYMTCHQLLDRLLRKRPLVFTGASDQYMLRDGITEGYGGFEAMDTERKGSAHDPSSPLQLGEYLSYDEMALSALLLLSVPTHFINNGARANRGQPARDAWYASTRETRCAGRGGWCTV